MRPEEGWGRARARPRRAEQPARRAGAAAGHGPGRGRCAPARDGSRSSRSGSGSSTGGSRRGGSVGASPDGRGRPRRRAERRRRAGPGRAVPRRRREVSAAGRPAGRRGGGGPPGPPRRACARGRRRRARGGREATLGAKAEEEEEEAKKSGRRVPRRCGPGAWGRRAARDPARRLLPPHACRCAPRVRPRPEGKVAAAAAAPAGRVGRPLRLSACRPRSGRTGRGGARGPGLGALLFGAGGALRRGGRAGVLPVPSGSCRHAAELARTQFDNKALAQRLRRAARARRSKVSGGHRERAAAGGAPRLTADLGRPPRGATCARGYCGGCGVWAVLKRIPIGGTDAFLLFFSPFKLLFFCCFFLKS